MSNTPTGAALTIWELAKRCRPLAEFQRAHKPNLATLRIFASDYALLLKHPATARLYGFSVDGSEIMFQGFVLVHDGEIRGQHAPAES